MVRDKVKMPETKIEISDLKSEGGDLIKELSQLMKEKTKAEIETATDCITIKSKDKAVSRTYLKVILKKFLHQQGLKEHFRIIGGRENTLVVKEIKVSEEEE